MPAEYNPSLNVFFFKLASIPKCPVNSKLPDNTNLNGPSVQPLSFEYDLARSLFYLYARNFPAFNLLLVKANPI